jgi:hypothetical protein
MHLPPLKKGRGIGCKSGANKISDRCQKDKNSFSDGCVATLTVIKDKNRFFSWL